MTILLYPNHTNKLQTTRIITTSTILNLSDSFVKYTGSNVATISLPKGRYYLNGLTFTIKNASEYLVTITSETSDLIDNETTQSLNSNDSITIVFNQQWNII